jgi:hypothetical protein
LGALSSLARFPRAVCEHCLVAPPLGGRDIIEKLVLISGGLLLAATARCGHLAMNSSPAPAAEVER